MVAQLRYRRAAALSVPLANHAKPVPVTPQLSTAAAAAIHSEFLECQERYNIAGDQRQVPNSSISLELGLAVSLALLLPRQWPINSPGRRLLSLQNAPELTSI